MDRNIFDETHVMFRESFRRFVEKEISPNITTWDTNGIVPRELFKAAGDAGFLALQAPESFGGGGTSDFRFNAIIGEELMYAGTGGAGLGMTLGGLFSVEMNEQTDRRYFNRHKT